MFTCDEQKHNTLPDSFDVTSHGNPETAMPESAAQSVDPEDLIENTDPDANLMTSPLNEDLLNAMACDILTSCISNKPQDVKSNEDVQASDGVYVDCPVAQEVDANMEVDVVVTPNNVSELRTDPSQLVFNINGQVSV